MGKSGTITGGLSAKGQDATPLTQLSGTYQVVTQTRWMRPDAKRANRRQRRTGEARGDKEGGQNGYTRHSYVESRRNLGPSESWGNCLEGKGMTTAGGPQMGLLMPRTRRQEMHAHYQLCPKYHLTSLSWLPSDKKEKER